MVRVISFQDRALWVCASVRALGGGLRHERRGWEVFFLDVWYGLLYDYVSLVLRIEYGRNYGCRKNLSHAL